MDKLEDTVGKLEHLRQKHEHTIANLKETVRTQEQSHIAIQSMASELQATKLALDELTKHHRQVSNKCRITGLLMNRNL